MRVSSIWECYDSGGTADALVMGMNEIAAILAASKTPHQERMERAFALVSPDLHAKRLGYASSELGLVSWKDPIAALVPQSELDASGVTIQDVAEAVEFFTATTASITAEKIGRIGSRDFRGAPGFLVLADGYCMGPAGDH